MDRRNRYDTFRNLQPIYRLDKQLIASFDTKRDKQLCGFETEEASVSEDRTRIRLMRQALARANDFDLEEVAGEHLLLQQADDVLDLLKRLTIACDSGVHCGSLASSLASRSLRMSMIGDLLHRCANFKDSDIVTFTVLNKHWVFTAEELLNTTASKLKLKFLRQLRHAGVANVKGFLMAFLHGEFEPGSGKFVVHLHGVTTKGKYGAMRESLSGRWGYVRSASGAAPIRCEQVNDRYRQFSYLLKAFWPAKAIRSNDGKLMRDRNGKRISEPFASLALVWLDRQSVTDITVVTGGGNLSSGQRCAAGCKM